MSRRLLWAGAGAALALAVLLPVVAFGVVPIFVRSSVQEAAPGAVTPGPAAPPPVAGSGLNVTPEPIRPRLLLAGELRRVDPVHYGSGRVSVLDTGTSRVLRFDSVAIAGAPNMYVYLSDRADGQPGRFTDLGPLRATDGSFNYELAPSVDLAEVRSVVVWCRAFSVTVTFAPLGAA